MKKILLNFNYKSDAWISPTNKQAATDPLAFKLTPYAYSVLLSTFTAFYSKNIKCQLERPFWEVSLLPIAFFFFFFYSYCT